MWRAIVQSFAISLVIALTAELAYACPAYQDPAPPVGQDPKTEPKQDEKKPEKKVIPPSETVSLETKDKVLLKCEWFPGVNGKDSVPVILVHDWTSHRKKTMLGLADRLQSELGCAVIVPDLRGHGDSNQVIGGSKKLDYEEFSKDQLATVGFDIEACKSHLKTFNNKGELNLNMLVVLAVGQTTPIATAWAIDDWNWPPLGGVQQGQDVKGLILISPVRKFRTLNLSSILKSPALANANQSGITTYLIWDDRDTESDREANAIESVLRKALGDDAFGVNAAPEKLRLSSGIANGGSGELLIANSPDEGVFQLIAGFLHRKLIDRAESYPWQDRSEKK